jgi:DNA-binding MarR family transcriptional regulator
VNARHEQGDPAFALLALLAEEDGQSMPRVAKRLGLAASELQRLLVVMGDDPNLGGLNLIEPRPSDRSPSERPHLRLWLTERGRALCHEARSA